MNKDQFTIVELMYILDKMDYYEMSSGYIGETPDGKIEVFPQMKIIVLMAYLSLHLHCVKS